MASCDGNSRQGGLPAARDFVTDAFAHGKYIGYAGGTVALFEAAGLAEKAAAARG